MKASTLALLDAMTAETPALEGLKKEIGEAAELLIGCFSSGGRLYVCGCGGSARIRNISRGNGKSFPSAPPSFRRGKGALSASLSRGRGSDRTYAGRSAAHSLVSACGALSAHRKPIWAANMSFLNRWRPMRAAGDVLLCFSTSGNSRPVVNAAKMARFLGARAVALTGKGGGKLAEVCDILLAGARNGNVPRAQLHMPLYHVLCAAVEEEFFGK